MLKGVDKIKSSVGGSIGRQGFWKCTIVGKEFGRENVVDLRGERELEEAKLAVAEVGVDRGRVRVCFRCSSARVS
jgi:hypothetical protein